MATSNRPRGFDAEATTTIAQTPIFYETIAAALDIDVPLAAGIYREVSDVTDLHRVEETLGWAA
jgi:hypothetical protein